MKIHYAVFSFCLALLPVPYQCYSTTYNYWDSSTGAPIASTTVYSTTSYYHTTTDQNNHNPSVNVVQCSSEYNGNCYLYVYVNRTHPRFIPVANNALNIKTVVLRGNVYVLGDDICNAFPNAERLDLDYSTIERILPGAFDKCTKVTFIELNGNNIKHLPRETFRFNQKVNKLHMRGSKLRNLDEWLFTSLFNLTDLQLGDNYLTEFNPDLLKTNREITTLNVAKNELLDVDENKLLENLPKLNQLSLDNNHISCDRLQQIRDSLQGSGVYLNNNYYSNNLRKRFYLQDTLDNFLCVPRTTWLELYNQRKALSKGDTSYQISVSERRN